MMAHPPLSALDAARLLTARGWVVFPADRPDSGLHCSGSARACRERRCGAESDASKRGKHPAVVSRWGALSAPAAPEQLAEWFAPTDSGQARYNVAVACGPSGLLVVDDDAAGGFERYAESIGEKVPDTFRVATSQGWHHYFTVPAGPAGSDLAGVRVPVGNAPGLLAPFGCDVRGGASPSHPHGGYVIGPGSQHWTDDPGAYLPVDWDAPACEAPEWLITAVTTPGPSATAEGLPSRTGTAGHASGLTRWDSAPRYGSEADLRAQFARHCAEVTEPGNAFRWGLFLAARDGWRLVSLGLLDEDTMQRRLAAVVWRVWQAEPDERDIKIVMGEALDGPHGAIASPWQLTEAEVRERARAAGSRPVGRFGRPGDAVPAVIEPGIESISAGEPVTSDNGAPDHTTYGNLTVSGAQDSTQLSTGPSTGTTPGVDVDLSSVEALAEADIPPAPAGIPWDKWRDDWRREYGRQTVQDAVRAHRQAADLPTLAMLDYDTWDAVPDPSYLVPRLFYRDGIAQVFGAPGIGKSYFVLDAALSLAADVPWREHRLTGRDGGPGKVHYIMAEGLDVNKLRKDAFVRHHKVNEDLLRRHFVVSDGEGLILTVAGIAQYRPFVQLFRPDLIILDTKNALFTGEESSAKDHGDMIRALNTLRKDAGGAAVVLIGHSGLGAPERSRGSNAEEAGTSTSTRITRDKDSGVFTATEKRDKSSEPGTEWHWRLERVDEVPRGPFMAAPAVCVPIEPSAHTPFATDTAWWADELPEPIREAIDQAREIDKDGRSLAAKGKKEAKLIMLLLRSAQTTEGLVQTRIRQMINETRKPDDQVKLWAITRACALLLAEGLVDDVGTPATKRYIVATPYTTREMPE